MLPNSALRASARASLKGKWANYVVFTLILFILTYAILPVILYLHSIKSLVLSEIVQIVWSLALIPLAYGFEVCFMAKDENTPAPKAGVLFAYYNQSGRIIGTLLLMGIYIIGWTLLLVIPGIIKTCSYAMTPYILKDNPELSYDAAISRSSAMMKGHKMQYFLLNLSFIGWAFLCIFTFGIGLLFLLPYIYMSLAKFYESVRQEYAQGRAPLN